MNIKEQVTITLDIIQAQGQAEVKIGGHRVLEKVRQVRKTLLQKKPWKVEGLDYSMHQGECGSLPLMPILHLVTKKTQTQVLSGSN